MEMQLQQDEHDKKNGTRGCEKPTGTEQGKNSPYGLGEYAGRAENPA